MSQKLDSFSKILLATGSINYMAAAIDGVANEMKFMDSEVAQQSAKDKFALLHEIVEKLSPIMEELGNYMHVVDCISPIDVRATKAAFEIIVHEMDDTEESYEDDDDEIK